MKKTTVTLSILCLSLMAGAQDENDKPDVTIKWAPTGLYFGNISIQGEYSFTEKSSLTAKIGIPIRVRHTFAYQDDDADFDMKAFSFLAGYRRYLSKKPMQGLYVEPFFKYVHHTSEGFGNSRLNGQPVTMMFTNEYNAAGIGAQLGVQFLFGKRFVVDLFFFGPEINSARSNFRATEITNTIGWTTLQADEAEQDIRDFLDQFPFIRNRVDVKVDKANRTVTADFKGAMPGIRAGVSVGISL